MPKHRLSVVGGIVPLVGVALELKRAVWCRGDGRWGVRQKLSHQQNAIICEQLFGIDDLRAAGQVCSRPEVV